MAIAPHGQNVPRTVGCFQQPGAEQAAQSSFESKGILSTEIEK